MVEIGLASHTGRIHSRNEDFVYHGPTPHGYVGIVCDGMGGHQAGETAARLAAQAIYTFLNEASPKESENLVRDALLHANQSILSYAQENPNQKNLGSTAVVALLTSDNTLIYGNVGDSRLYLYQKGNLQLLTQDDSLVQQMLNAGIISPEQALHHPQKNVLSQTLGQNPAPIPHVKKQRINRNSIVLLCTDGISNALSREEIQTILSQPTKNLNELAEALVRKAIQQGGYDDSTVLLLAPPFKKATFASLMNLKLPPPKYLIGGAIGLVVLVILIFFFTRSRPTANPAGEQVIVLSDDTTQTPDTTSPYIPEGESEEVAFSSSPPSPVSPPTELPASPSSPPLPTPEKPPKSPERSTYLVYTIQKGDNLNQIAKAFSVSREELRKINNLRSDNIQAGKKLKIPVQSIQTHTVKEKETLSSIARRYHTTLEAIRKANGLENEKIRSGQKLTVPVVKK
ncbi:MAG: LysM peptidoglycan-binding domain-containing protein [Bacteroidia bacterium]|nr:LysM peptidoglycan-binding domain-containing protein [Bacteroidia bacterium]MDW8134294.1 LysM peptidoglycan-binding domain-containing protein [Bacteroidia bacterium]